MNMASCLSSCDSAIDKLQSIIEKLKLFLLPIFSPSSNGQRHSALLTQIERTLVLCTSMGITILKLRTVLSNKVGQVSTSFVRAISNLVQPIVMMRDKINKLLVELMVASSGQEVSDAKYIDHLEKAVSIIRKLLNSCSEKMLVVIEAAHLPNLQKTTDFFERMLLAPADIGSVIFTSQLDDVCVHFERFVAETSRDVSDTALERSKTLDSATVNASLLDSPGNIQYTSNANIERLFSRKMSKTTKPTKAELEGFVSRTKTTRREPNWKIDAVGLSPGKRLRSNPPSDFSSQLAPPTPQKIDSWPLGSSGSEDPHLSSSTTVSIDDLTRDISSISIDEIYDSYHDHDLDATLGLAGPNAVAALKRQPSHKKQLAHATQVRTKSLPSHSPGNGRPSEKLARYPIRKEQHSLAVPTGSIVLAKVASMPLDDIRDQYY